MKAFRQQLVLALIAATATIGATVAPAVIERDKKSSSEPKPSATETSTICDKVFAAQVCVANLTVQVNSDEPQLVKNNERIPLKAGDTLKVSNLSYCIPSKATVNKFWSLD